MSEKKKCIHDGHRKRLIDTVYEAGLDRVSDIQALEYILFYVFPRGDVNPLAHRLLDRFHHISTVLEASIEDLQMVEGMGETSAKKLHAFTEIFFLYSSDKNKAHPARTAGELFDHLEQLLRFKSIEMVYIMGVNAKGETVQERKLAQGSYENVRLDVKDIVLYVSTHKVKRVILVHNHPNGSCNPSPDDIAATANFKLICSYAGCSLIDSLIVGSDGIYSIETRVMKRRFTQTSEEALQKLMP